MDVAGLYFFFLFFFVRSFNPLALGLKIGTVQILLSPFYGDRKGSKEKFISKH